MSQVRVARASGVCAAWGIVPDFEPFAQNASGSCFFTWGGNMRNRGFPKEDRRALLALIPELGSQTRYDDENL